MIELCPDCGNKMIRLRVNYLRNMTRRDFECRPCVKSHTTFELRKPDLEKLKACVGDITHTSRSSKAAPISCSSARANFMASATAAGFPFHEADFKFARDNAGLDYTPPESGANVGVLTVAPERTHDTPQDHLASDGAYEDDEPPHVGNTPVTPEVTSTQPDDVDQSLLNAGL